MSERTDQESLVSQLTALEETVETLETRVDALGAVSDELTSKEEKYAAVLELAFEKDGESDTISVGPHEIRECTGVSRRYAYDLIDAMGSSVSGCEVRDSAVVETITGTQRRTKALVVDCDVVRNQEHSSLSPREVGGRDGESESVRSSTAEIGGSSAVELDILNGLTPRGFEAYVADIWRASGYTCHLTKRGRDCGVDVVADKSDKRLLIQAKRYTSSDVGIETIQRVAGLLVDDEFAASGVLVVTTSGYTRDARQRAERINGIELVDGNELVSRGRDADLLLHGMDHGYETELTAQEVHAVLDEGEPMTTTEVADALETDPGSVLVHLESLVDKGAIRVKQLGEEYGVWYR
ncbi:restriction endonuclease [Halosegnis rubeus]|uniref:Restriction endonuclease type IV Mrr domain-containing protein n=1 Tax=Halosegnis rubeus TaxID=2212850 RepID=A0A5N5UQ05_9EURY|nr:restriction endonuclease [Halosegnis rubeus]KAB7519457.1 hypothetical protein DP108_04975 [Halosegnis rubeus]